MKRILYVMVSLVLMLPTNLVVAGDPVELAMAERIQIETDIIVDESTDLRDTVDAAVLYYVSGAPNHPMNRKAKRAEFVETVLTVSQETGVPAPLIVTVAFYESSLYTNLIGAARKEIGLMQVHGQAAANCDLTTAYGQLHCGSTWLRKAYDTCGMSWKRALTMYATGKCQSKSDSVQHLVAFRLRKWETVENL